MYASRRSLPIEFCHVGAGRGRKAGADRYLERVLELEANYRLHPYALDCGAVLDARVVAPARDRLERGRVEDGARARVDDERVSHGSRGGDRELYLHPT